MVMPKETRKAKVVDGYVFVRGFYLPFDDKAVALERRDWLTSMRANVVKTLLIQHGVADQVIIATGVSSPLSRFSNEGAQIDVVPR